MGLLKKLARGLKKSAPMGAAVMVAKTAEPAIKKASPAPVGAIGTGMLPPPGAETGPAGKGFYTPPGAETAPPRRGFFGKIQQAARKIGPAVKEAAPAMKKDFEANPAKAVAGGARKIGQGIGRGIVQGIGRMKFKDGGAVTASRSVVSSGRGDGAAIRGKTKCKMY